MHYLKIRGTTRNIQTFMSIKSKCSLRWLSRQWKYGFSAYSQQSKPCINQGKSIHILGIETSCDDTGAAVVTENGSILGEGYSSQVISSVKFGGVIPSVSRRYHDNCIHNVVKEALEKSGRTPEELTAVAATVQPGNLRTLIVGSSHGKEIALKYKLPFIPVHHMEAHALTVRMEHQVDFPFLVLLVSGGHCILAVAHSIDEWSIIGETLDSSPGNVFDQVARRMKLRNLKGMENVIGGRAIEILSQKGDPTKYPFPNMLSKYRDSNFSFSGIESFGKDLIRKLEKEKGIEGGNVLDEVNDLCASFQYAVTNHLLRKTHRGMKFAELTGRIPDDSKTLVISGGVASNHFLRDAFDKLCQHEGYRLLIPPPKLCVDNGIMVAWNGVERMLAGKGVFTDEDSIKAIKIQHRSPLGPSLATEQRSLDLRNPKWIKII